MPRDIKLNMPSNPDANPKQNRKSLFKIPRSRFSEFIEPLSLEFSNEIDVKDGGSSHHDSDSDSDDDDSNNACFPSLKKPSVGLCLVAEITFLLVIVPFLASTLTISYLKQHSIAGLHLWKIALLLLVIFCGRLISDSIVRAVFLLVPRRVYLIHSMRGGVATYVWLCFLTILWGLCFDHSVFKGTSKLIHDMYKALPAILSTLIIWQGKRMIFDMFISTFYLTLFYKKMNAAVFHLFMLEALTGPELSDEDREMQMETHMKSAGKKLDRMTAVALSKRRVPRHVADRILLGHIDSLKKSKFKVDSQSKILKAAREAFKNVARRKDYIERGDMSKFLTTEEVDILFPIIEEIHGEGKINESSFLKWAVGTYRRRKSLVHAIADTKMIVWNLNIFANIFIGMILFVATLVFAGVTTTKVLAASFSQFLLLGVVFQNTAKTVFECIVFVFMRHPFDVGDCCIVDGAKMIVEEMNIFTTVFLQFDHEKIYYPNSELATKPISNYSRSPDMGEKIEFSIDVSTPDNTIDELRKLIKGYLEGKPEQWQEKHVLLMKGIEESRIKMNLCVFHKLNYQNFHEMERHKSELLFKLKNIFVNLKMKDFVIS